MSNNTDIFGIDKQVTQNGVLGEFKTSAEIRVRFVVENAQVSNSFSVYGKIKGQTSWNIITTLAGNAIEDVTIAQYDFILIITDSYASVSNYVHLLASGIAQTSEGLSSITAGGNALIGLDNVNLTSNNNTITITSNTSTGVIDFSVAGLNTVDDLVTLSGVAKNATDLGTFSGNIIPNSSDNKEAFQALETAIENLPDPMEYKGLWAANTNTPTLANGTGNNGDVYQVTAGGSVNFGTGTITFVAGDKVVYNGSTSKYEKWNMTDAVSSVNGYTGAITLVKGDLSLGNVDNTSDATKNAAAVTLTNKTLTSPVINSPTGLVKADVGLSNVDNVADSLKPVSTAQAQADTAVQAFSIQRANHTGSQTSSTISDFTEASQDAVGATLTDTNTIDLTYTDSTNTIIADVKISNSTITSDVNGIKVGTVPAAQVSGLATVATSGLKADIGLGNVVNLNTSTTANITDSLNKRFVTDAFLATGGSQSGTNTGDQTAATVPNTPAGNIAATTVQGALNELDSEKVSAVSGDIIPTSFSAANNQISAANVTGFSFASAVVRSFQALVSVYVDGTLDLFETFSILGLQKNGDFFISIEGMGDNTGVLFSITTSGQIQYTSTNISGFVSSTIKFRALVVGV